MSKWDAVFTNDPARDYALVIELVYQSEEFAWIQTGPNGLELRVFPNSHEVIIPVPWLVAQINLAAEKLKEQE